MEKFDLVGLLNAAQQLAKKVDISLMYSGLRLSQLRVLELLEGGDEPTVTMVSKRLHITRATASTMIGELIDSGVLVVEENPADRRSFHLRITDSGRNKLSVARSDLAVLAGKVSRWYPLETIRHLNAFAQAMAERKYRE